MAAVFNGLAESGCEQAWVGAVVDLAETRMAEHRHGDLPRWRAALRRLPQVRQQALLDRPAPCLGMDVDDPGALRDVLMEFHPWRKGPLVLGGLEIDTEWRSDWKWARIEPHIDLSGHRVLDIGCGNGYFGLRMLAAGAELVMGIDPTLLFVMQHRVCRHFSGDIPNYVLPLAVEELPDIPVALDTVFSMGVLYHRRDPVRHLARIHGLLRDGGTVVLETLVLPESRADELLVPEGRYARMRNVWAVPGIHTLGRWVAEAGFRRHEVVDVTPTTTGEQRSTGWMRFESLEQALDREDHAKTIEGLPAPIRATVIARR
jgi:tRNA (mo5U34)-methyltransferase